jgi:hypothetical protein
VDLGAQERSAKSSRRHPSAARIWTCDFTADYVRINAGYRS